MNVISETVIRASFIMDPAATQRCIFTLPSITQKIFFLLFVHFNKGFSLTTTDLKSP